MSGRRAGCPGLREGPDVRARGADVRADGESFCRFWCVAPDFRASGRISGLGPDVRAGRRMFGPCRHGRQGFGWCGRSRGRMSGAWKVNLPVSVGSLHPWTWRLVRLHVYAREVPLDT